MIILGPGFNIQSLNSYLTSHFRFIIKIYLKPNKILTFNLIPWLLRSTQIAPSKHVDKHQLILVRKFSLLVEFFLILIIYFIMSQDRSGTIKKLFISHQHRLCHLQELRMNNDEAWKEIFFHFHSWCCKKITEVLVLFIEGLKRIFVAAISIWLSN